MPRFLFFAAILAVVGFNAVSQAWAQDQTAYALPIAPGTTYAVRTGLVVVSFDHASLDPAGWSFAAQDKHSSTAHASRVAFAIDQGSFGKRTPVGLAGLSVVKGNLQTRGALLLSRHGERLATLGNLRFSTDSATTWIVTTKIGIRDSRQIVFVLADVAAEVNEARHELHLTGTLTVDPSWAATLENPEMGGATLGQVTLHARGAKRLSPSGAHPTAESDGPSSSRASTRTANGPDVIVRDLQDIGHFGSLGGISAFSIGTIACNIGDTPASWFGNTNQHPVIAQNLYRLMDGRFEQIGMSWLKHGFFATEGGGCGSTCISPPLGGKQLGVGCSDPYSSSLNGQQSNLGPRSDVNPHTGDFVFPWSAPPAPLTIGRRLQVHNSDLGANQNPGALYFGEAQYVLPDDAAAGHQNNNASFRRITVTDNFTSFTLALTALTNQQRAAIRAWQDYQPTVTQTNIQVPGDGLFILAADTTDLGNGFWHYEYALYNMNADRAAGSFSVPLDPGATVQNIGFHDVDYHSFEIFDGTDWVATVSAGSITWSTQTFATNANANALRWGTLYNFRFDADVAPHTLSATLGLFQPGTPATAQGLTAVPATPPPQCGNAVVEAGEQCEPPDGVVCDAACQSIVNDPIRGGLLWDKWWVVNLSLEPTGNHSLYPPTGLQSGSITFRCKECHGWDYKGVDGAYGTGPHFTGIKGVWGTAMTPAEMFTLIQSDAVPQGHGFQNMGMVDQDARDLIQFILDLAIDTDAFIDTNNLFIGDPAQGQLNYTSGAATNCITCHGADGTTINFGTLSAPEWVGTVAADNPWELLHKIRVGQPGSPMPSWLAGGGTNQGAADIGRYAQQNLPAVCMIDAHCNDGLFCNGVESCSNGTCLAGTPPCPNQPCNEAGGACGVADPFRGGKLFDAWWKETGLPEPAGTHPLYPPAGAQSGFDTFRCAECHGWDYKGVSGTYSTGPHFTGILGVFGSTLAPGEMFQLLQSDTVTNGHGFGSLGLSDNDIWDVVAFVQDLVIDTDTYIDANGIFVGDATQGQVHFETGGSISCIVCHGVDGTDINFGTLSQPQWVGTIAFDDPWRFLHKVRMGNAGFTMPSWILDGGTDQGAADIGRYAQLNLPVDCLGDAQCDDGLYCTGVESCFNGLCQSGVAPCAAGLCDESITTCLSGLCDAPIIDAADNRYLTVTPAPSAGAFALRVTGDSLDASVTCLSAYVQADHTLGPSPVFRTQAQWGTVFVHDTPIRPDATYHVRADCGTPGLSDLSFRASATTPHWGDVDQNSVVNGNDILLVVLAFQLDFTLVTLPQVDVEPCVPNGVINGLDIQRVVRAFQRNPFDEMGCPVPCP